MIVEIQRNENEYMTIDLSKVDDEDTDGTKNTEFGSELYYLIENAIMSSIDYQGRE